MDMFNTSPPDGTSQSFLRLLWEDPPTIDILTMNPMDAIYDQEINASSRNPVVQCNLQPLIFNNNIDHNADSDDLCLKVDVTDLYLNLPPDDEEREEPSESVQVLSGGDEEIIGSSCVGREPVEFPINIPSPIYSPLDFNQPYGPSHIPSPLASKGLPPASAPHLVAAGNSMQAGTVPFSASGFWVGQQETNLHKNAGEVMIPNVNPANDHPDEENLDHSGSAIMVINSNSSTDPILVVNSPANYPTMDADPTDNKYIPGNMSSEELSMLYGCTIPPLPHQCSNCKVMRRTIYSDGFVTKRFEIHGYPGCNLHAVLALLVRDQPGGSVCHGMVELASFQHARSVVVDYLAQHLSGMSVLVNDTTSELYTQLIEAFPSLPINHNTGLPLPPIDVNTGNLLLDRSIPNIKVNNNIAATSHPTKPAAPTSVAHSRSKPFRIPKSKLALQRERAAGMALEELQGYMHLPLTEAARRLSICPSVVKKICRRYGVTRWPYRRVKAMDRIISALQYQSLETEAKC